MVPRAPPSKKQRSSAPIRGRHAPTDTITSDADAAIARRRAELRRLQQMGSRSNVNASSATSVLGGGQQPPMSKAEGLLAQARSSLSASGSAPAMTRRPSPMLPPGGMTEATSSILKQAEKTLMQPKPVPPVATAAEAPVPTPVDGIPPIQQPIPASRPPVVTKESARKIVRNLDSTFAGAKAPLPKNPARSKSAPPARPPPPPLPPKLVVEAPPSVEKTHLRPQPISPSGLRNNRSSSTPRADLLRSMRASADTPPKAATQSGKLLLELQKTQREKEDAFRKLQRLQEQVIQLRKEDSTRAKELETVLYLADQKGEAAAVKWARSQVDTPIKGSSTAQVNFLSPDQSNGRRPTSGVVRSRVATPQPKRDGKSSEGKELLLEATEATPDEFYSELATYVVRRPYCIMNSDPSFWDMAGIQSVSDYEIDADADKPMTIEVAAKIRVDGSVLTLSSASTVRHLKPHDATWKVYEDVDERDKPMGCVMYIDGDANEREYWLDEIYEEALSTRETYCSSLISTAAALRRNQLTRPPETDASHIHLNGSAREPVELPPPPEPIIKEVYVERPRPQMADAQVDTQDLMPIVPKKAKPKKVENREEERPARTEAPEHERNGVTVPAVAPPPEEEGASDVLSVMLGWIFTTIFGLVWFILIKVPIRIFSYTLFLSIAGGILSVVWLYVADDHGAMSMGAGMNLGFNSYGIQ